MKRSTRTWVTLVALIGTLLLLGGASLAENGRDGTLNYGFTGQIPEPGFDPAVVVSDAATIILRNTYGRLVEYSEDATELHPGLAKNWEVSNDGLTYTFHLREGVKFHDGTPLKAEDVYYSFNRVMEIGEGYSWLLTQNIAEDGITVQGEHQLKIRLKKPFPAFLNVMADQHVANVVNSAVVKEHASDEDPWAKDYLYDHAPGTGPFKLTEWKHNQYIALERNEGYWEGKPKLEKIIFQIIPEPETASLMLRKGELDMVQKLPTEITNFVAAKEGIKISSAPALQYTQFLFNHRIPPLDNKKVRQAICYAINYESLMKNIVGREQGVRMKGMLLQGMLGYDSQRFGYSHRPEKARELLQEAGHPDGFEISIEYPVWGNIPRMAVLIQANLAEVGIRAKLKEMAFGPFLEAVKNGDIPIFPWEGSPAYNEPSGFLYPKLHSKNIGKGSGGNVAAYSNPKVDKLLEEVMEELDEERRAELYGEIDEIVTRDAYGIFLYQNVLRRSLRTWVKGYTTPVLQGPDFSEVYIEKK